MLDLQPVTEDEMRERLQKAFRKNSEDSLLWQFRQHLRNPGCPADKKYRQYLRPSVLIITLAFAVVFLTFVCFTWFGR